MVLKFKQDENFYDCHGIGFFKFLINNNLNFKVSLYFIKHFIRIWYKKKILRLMNNNYILF